MHERCHPLAAPGCAAACMISMLPRRRAFLSRAWAITAICLAALLATSASAFFVFERLPHLEDEVAYIFQAKTLALGRLTVPSPEHADAFWFPFVLDYQGQRFGKYPPGWPAVLAVGELAHLPWLVNPVLAALALYLVYRLGRMLYDTRTGLLAAALGLTSPLLLVLGGSYLSHLASMVLLLLFSLSFVQVARGGNRWLALASGASLGIAFLCRSLTAVGYAAPFILYALTQVALRRQRHWPNTLLIALGGAALASLLPLYQWAVTGDPWLNPYLLWWPYDKIGFGPGIGWMPGGHSLHYAWLNLRQDLANAATDVLGWPGLSWAPLALALALPPTTPGRRRRDWLLLTPFVGLVSVYLFYWIGSPMRFWGPRYYFEGFGGLWILAAVGLLRLWNALRTRPHWSRTLALAGLALLLVVNLGINLPPRLAQAKGFYGISRAQLSPIEQAEIHNALVFVKAKRWLEYGALLTEMGPLLTDDVLYPRSTTPQADAAVMDSYPERTVYYLVNGELAPLAK